jgi:DNA-binding IclR family transcriptional regulator
MLSHVIDHGPQTLTELARASDLPASTTLRITRALEEWAFLARAADGRFEAGPRFVRSRVTVDTQRSEDLTGLATPIMRRLTAETRETSYLAVPGPARTCVYLREIQSEEPVRYVGSAGWTGRVVPLDDSAVGQVLDGNVSAGGYCVRPAALAPEATVVAAPVWGADDQIIAVLSIAGPTFRMTDTAVEHHGPRVVQAAADLRDELLGTA